MRLLIVEDEKRLATSLARGLTAEGFAVDVVHDGLEGLHLAGQGVYDLVVLDIMLPGMNGYRICAALRAAGHETPILMLTAKDGEYDEAEGLDTAARRVHRGEDEVTLTTKEFAVLEQLVRRAGEVVSKADILEHVWDFAYDGDPNIVEVYISTLRRKLGAAAIRTVRGAGYRLEAL